MSNTYVTAIIDDRLDAYLQRMADSGLYGADKSDVLLFALLTAAQAAVSAGIIQLTPPPVEDEEEVEAPRRPPHEREPTGHSCPHTKADDNCGKPGCLGDEVPF